jgi:hypothetical protein
VLSLSIIPRSAVCLGDHRDGHPTSTIFIFTSSIVASLGLLTPATLLSSLVAVHAGATSESMSPLDKVGARGRGQERSFLILHNVVPHVKLSCNVREDLHPCLSFPRPLYFVREYVLQQSYTLPFLACTDDLDQATLRWVSDQAGDLQRQ